MRAEPSRRSPGPLLRGAALLSGVLVCAAAEAVPEIETWKTASGAEALFVQAPELPIVDVRVVFDAGSARDGGRPGLASLTAAMLTEGAGGLDADAFAERVESVGAELDAGAGRDQAYARIRALAEPGILETAVESLAKVLAEPAFDEAAFDRVRENRLTGLRRALQDPGEVGQRALYRAVFGDHPYAEDPSGTATSVAALEVADLRRFHARHYAATNATVAIVGALERAQAARLAERITAALPEAEPLAPLPPVDDLERGRSQRIEFPSSQTHVYLGQPGMRRGDPDYFPLYVGNHILGGSGLVSLLMEEVREKRGLSYSTYSYFLPLSRRGPLLMGLQTRSDQADEAEAVLRETLRRFIAQGPSAEELEAAVKNLTGGFPLRIAGNDKIVRYLAVIGFYDLPLDYLERFTERVRAVTAEQIRDAFQRRVHPQRLAEVMVGPQPRPEAVEPEAAEPEAAEGAGGSAPGRPAAAAGPGDG